MRVGFIGLGNMGSEMALNLLNAGHEVTGYNRTASKLQALVALGAHAAAQPADACRGDVVITMLTDDAAVEGVAFGETGIIAGLGKDAIHISMSTISVAQCGGREVCPQDHNGTLQRSCRAINCRLACHLHQSGAREYYG
jgi:3-hydroxyisobutyrate dehydrogenase-like beta-hydroxyacid dehydrogenase